MKYKFLNLEVTLMDKLRMETLCIQAGYNPKNGEPRQIPIYQSTTFKYDTSEAFPVYFLALFQSKQIFFSCGLNHSGLLVTVIFCYYIIANFSNLCNRKLCRMVVSPVF